MVVTVDVPAPVVILVVPPVLLLDVLFPVFVWDVILVIISLIFFCIALNQLLLDKTTPLVEFFPLLVTATVVVLLHPQSGVIVAVLLEPLTVVVTVLFASPVEIVTLPPVLSL